MHVEHARIAQTFDELAELKAQRVQSRLDGYARSLLDLRGLFVADPRVTETEFQRFLHGVEVTRRYPALLRFGYAVRVTDSNRASLEDYLRVRNVSDYALSDDDHAILYGFPPHPSLLGNKLNEGEARSAVLGIARDSGEPKLSGKLALRFEGRQQAGHLMYVALYGTHLTPDTVGERRRLLSGFLFASFHIDELIASTIGSDLEHRMGLALFDGTSADAARLLHDSDHVLQAINRNAGSGYRSVQRVDALGRPWTFVFIARPPFVRDNQSMLPVAVVAGGVLTSILAAWLTNVAMRRWLVERRIRDLAFHDELTGLPNRVMLRRAIGAAIRREKETRQPCALLIVELLRFREINYTLGHAIGDEVLTQASARIGEMVAGNGLVARISNVQFGVLLPDVGIREAIQYARRLIDALEDPLLANGNKYELGARAGIVALPFHGSDGDDLIRHADIARNIAQTSGSDFAIYDAALDPYQPQRLALLGAFRHAVKAEQLQLYCQPKADLRTGRITSVEGLVRWQHPDYGLILPNAFVSLIEPTELIHLLTQRMLEAAMRQCHQWRQQDMAVPLAVNLSTRNLLNPGLPELIGNLMHTWGADPGWIELEITESSIIADSPLPLRVIERLHAMGLKLSVDDFGTGYSSLSYLMRLPVAVLKIDNSFTTNMLQDADAAAIVKAIIELAHNVGMKVVAEGVASREIWDALTRLDCDEAQGFYISQPFPAHTFKQWLERSPWELALPAAPVGGVGTG